MTATSTGAGDATASAGSYFLPSPEAARRTDAAVRERLLRSLAWIGGEFPALAGLEGRGWTARPADFGFYYDLASAMRHGFAPDARANLDAVAEALAASVRSGGAPAAESPRVTTLGPSHYGRLERDALIRWFDMEPDNAMALLPLAPDDLSAAEAELSRALDLLRDQAPDFHGEFRAITTEIVFARPGPQARLRFGGASSFALWGALALNVEAHRDWWLYLPRIVHEYSHNLLFGIARDGPLVLNARDETYSSPLRDDPRPIDGIYHAAFVSAREALALQQVAEGLDAGDEPVAAYCRQTSERSARTFFDCLGVLKSHARFSDLGAAVMAECEAWAATRLEPAG